MRNFLSSLAVASVATSFSYLLGIAVGWTNINALNWVEISAVFTSFSCTYMCVMESRWNYPMGVITTLLWAYFFYTIGLYGSMLTNIYLPIALVYGWFRWGKDEDTRPVTTLKWNWKTIAIYSGVTVSGYILVLWAFQYWNVIFSDRPAVLPMWDASILAGTILAQFLLDNKKIETWVVWAVINVVAIWVYFTTPGAEIAGVQYIFFLANTVYGFHMWNKSKKLTSTA